MECQYFFKNVRNKHELQMKIPEPDFELRYPDLKYVLKL